MTSESPLSQKPKLVATGRKCTRCHCELTEDNITKYRLENSKYQCTPCSQKEKVDWWNRLGDAEYMFRKAKARAKQKGREFTITLQDVKAVDTDVCPIFHIPIKRYPMTAGSKANCARPDSKSLDRIDASKGYVPGNIRVISFRCNELLSNMTLEEFKLISTYYGSQI